MGILSNEAPLNGRRQQEIFAQYPGIEILAEETETGSLTKA